MKTETSKYSRPTLLKKRPFAERNLTDLISMDIIPMDKKIRSTPDNNACRNTLINIKPDWSMSQSH